MSQSSNSKRITTMLNKYGVTNARYLSEYYKTHNEIPTIDYTKPPIHSEISDKELTCYYLYPDRLAKWIRCYCSKPIRNIVAGYGLVKDDTIYQVIVLCESQMKQYAVRIGAMIDTPGYYVKERFNKLFSFIINELDHYSMYANVDLMYEYDSDYYELGFQVIQTKQIQYFWKDGDKYHTLPWIKRNPDKINEVTKVKDRGFIRVAIVK